MLQCTAHNVRVLRRVATVARRSSGLPILSLALALYSALTLVYSQWHSTAQQPGTAHRLREVDGRRAQTAVRRLALAQNLTLQRTRADPLLHRRVVAQR